MTDGFAADFDVLMKTAKLLLEYIRKIMGQRDEKELRKFRERITMAF